MQRVHRMPQNAPNVATQYADDNTTIGFEDMHTGTRSVAAFRVDARTSVFASNAVGPGIGAHPGPIPCAPGLREFSTGLEKIGPGTYGGLRGPALPGKEVVNDLGATVERNERFHMTT